MMMNDWVSFELIKTDVISFWLLCLPAFTIEEFANETIGWLHNDINLFWLDVQGGIVLDLIT